MEYIMYVRAMFPVLTVTYVWRITFFTQPALPLSLWLIDCWIAYGLEYLCSSVMANCL